jgi:hypothetical protein
MKLDASSSRLATAASAAPSIQFAPPSGYSVAVSSAISSSLSLPPPAASQRRVLLRPRSRSPPRSRSRSRSRSRERDCIERKQHQQQQIPLQRLSYHERLDRAARRFRAGHEGDREERAWLVARRNEQSMGSQSPCPPPLSLRLTDADFLGELYRFNSVLVKRCNFVAGDTGGASSSSSSFSSQLPEVVMRLVRTNIDFGARPRVYRDARTGEPVLLQCCCGQNPCGFEALCGCPIPEQCIWPPFMHTKEACDPPAASLPVPQEQANGV